MRCTEGVGVPPTVAADGRRLAHRDAVARVAMVSADLQAAGGILLVVNVQLQGGGQAGAGARCGPTAGGAAVCRRATPEPGPGACFGTLRAPLLTPNLGCRGGRRRGRACGWWFSETPCTAHVFPAHHRQPPPAPLPSPDLGSQTLGRRVPGAGRPPRHARQPAAQSHSPRGQR